jgi:predicted phosphodiesterase
MNILLIGDLHIRPKSFLECNQLFSEVYNLIDNNKYDIICLLGDILDSHSRVDLRSLCMANEFILNLSKKILTFVLIGNHDRINNSVYLTDEHPFTALKNIKNIVIVDKPIEYNNLLFCPFIPVNRFNDAIKDFNLENIKIIFAHQEFQNSIFKDQGDVYEKNVPIYSGHIHNSIRLGKIYYVGTPYQHTYFESSDKFILALNIENDKIIEEKIRLKIIKKRVQEINISELLNYKIDENYLTKLIISGDKKLLNNEKIQDILKHPKIFYKLSIDKKKIDIVEDNKDVKFIDLLNDRLKKEDKTLINLFNKINKKILN